MLRQGWRLEIKAYPKLTEKGAWRGGGADGSGAHGGFYTQDQARAAAGRPSAPAALTQRTHPCGGLRLHVACVFLAPFLPHCASAHAAGLNASVPAAAG